MTSLALLVSELLRAALQPGFLGPIAIGLALVRELGPEWKPSFLRFLLDLVLLALILLLVTIVALRLTGHPV
jgi:hypothetical protein